MQVLKSTKSTLRRFIFVAFNGNAARKASMSSLFSKEFCLGGICWVFTSGLLLLHTLARIALPMWLLLPLMLISVFTGCCWVVFPVLVYLVRRGDQLLAYQIMPGYFAKMLIGVLLWQQAVRGKLSFQFLCAILLDIAVAGILLHWPLTSSWQTLFRVALFLNTIFYIAFPLLLFLGQWFQHRMQKAIF